MRRRLCWDNSEANGLDSSLLNRAEFGKAAENKGELNPSGVGVIKMVPGKLSSNPHGSSGALKISRLRRKLYAGHALDTSCRIAGRVMRLVARRAPTEGFHRRTLGWLSAAIRLELVRALER
jgi:hypothetical protein